MDRLGRTLMSDAHLCNQVLWAGLNLRLKILHCTNRSHLFLSARESYQLPIHGLIDCLPTDQILIRPSDGSACPARPSMGITRSRLEHAKHEVLANDTVILVISCCFPFLRKSRCRESHRAGGSTAFAIAFVKQIQTSSVLLSQSKRSFKLLRK